MNRKIYELSNLIVTAVKGAGDDALALDAVFSLLRKQSCVKITGGLTEVEIKDVDFSKMPNDNEFYFVLDLTEGKRVHRGGHIKAHPTNFRSVFLCEEQLPDSYRNLKNNTFKTGYAPLILKSNNDQRLH